MWRSAEATVSQRYHADLVARADLRGCTITDLIKAALVLDRYVWEHRRCELLMRDPSTDEVRQIVLTGRDTRCYAAPHVLVLER